MGEKGPVTSQPEATNGTIPMPMPSSSPKTTYPHSPSSPIPQPDHTEKSPLKNTPDQAAPPSYDSVFPTGTQQKGKKCDNKTIATFVILYSVFRYICKALASLPHLVISLTPTSQSLNQGAFYIHVAGTFSDVNFAHFCCDGILIIILLVLQWSVLDLSVV